jgi:DNA repair protein RadC
MYSCECRQFRYYAQSPIKRPFFSPEDIQLTQRLVKAADVVGIECLDHVVVTQDAYRSMKEQGLMNSH